jgi:hypothetical protein
MAFENVNLKRTMPAGFEERIRDIINAVPGMEAEELLDLYFEHARKNYTDMKQIVINCKLLAELKNEMMERMS